MSETGRQKAKASWLSKPAVQKLAEDIATQLEYQPAGDLEPILKRLGGRLVIKDFWDLENTDSGSIEIDGPGKFDIYVSNLTSALRDRFTIAHEIGHYVLHYLYPRKNGEELTKVFATRYIDAENQREEWEANWFAASFLMPEEKFKAAYGRHGGDFSAIAEEFGVSRKAAKVRAKATGCTEE